MADTRLEKRGRHRRAVPSLFLAALVAALIVGITGAEAQKLTVWSGYPELEPFYRHVADGMKAKFPNLAVSVEAIPLREHEKRVALALASGGNGALVLELSTADATRYLNNDLLPKAPADVAASSATPQTSTASSATAPASAAPSMGCRCSMARCRCSTTSTCSKPRASRNRRQPWTNTMPMPKADERDASARPRYPAGACAFRAAVRASPRSSGSICSSTAAIS